MKQLFNISGNTLTSLKGEVSHFFQIFPPDLEDQGVETVEQALKMLENDLINLDGVLKIYSLDGRLYMNTFGSMSFSQAEITPQENPIQSFTGGEDRTINFYENYLTSGCDYIRLLSLKDLPQALYPFDVCSYPDFVLNIRKVPQLIAKKTLNMKRKLHFSSLFKGMKDIESEAAYSEAEELLDGVTRNEKALFEAEMYLILKSTTKDNLDQKTEEVIRIFKSYDASLFVEERGLSFLYQSLIPGVFPSFKRKFPCGSDYLSYLIPFQRDFIHERGIELVSRSNNELWLDIFHPSSINFNVLITGSSGQGKSMMANKILSHEVKRGTKALVLDLGNSFRKTSLYLNGEILSETFNPFQFKNPRYLKEFILAAVDEKIPKKEEGRLYESIKLILDDGKVQSFNELLSELERGFKGISYNFSELKEFFSNETKSLKNLTYCDLTNYPESIKAPLIIYLIEYFQNLSGKKVFIFDECWGLLSKNADYVAECFRTFRKHQASAIAISQNLDDFSDTQLGRVIIQNTYYKFLFKQALASSEFVDDVSRDLLLSVHSIKGAYSEFLLLSETIKKPVRYTPTEFEYELFTSDKADNLQQDEYWSEKGRFLSYQEAMKNYVAIKYPYWRFNEVF